MPNISTQIASEVQNIKLNNPMNVNSPIIINKSTVPNITAVS